MAKSMAAGPQARVHQASTAPLTIQQCHHTVLPPFRKPFPLVRRTSLCRARAGHAGAYRMWRSGIEFLKTSLTTSLLDDTTQTIHLGPGEHVCSKSCAHGHAVRKTDARQSAEHKTAAQRAQ